MRPGAALAAAAPLAGCAALPAAAPLAGAHVEAATRVLGGTTVEAYRYRPDTPAGGLLLLQHGFARHCANLRETAPGRASAGFTVPCLNAGMARGNPALAAAP